MLIPTVAAIPNILGYSYFGLNDITPFTFAIGNLAILYGLVRFNAFEFQLISQLPILKQLPVGVIILDHRQRIIEWNPLAEKMLNTQIKAPGVPIETLPIGEHLALEKNTLWHADDHHFELQFHMLDTQETVDSYMITLKDITERVNQHFTLQTSNQTLETLLDELTNAQEQLLSTEKQKSMTSLIQSIAHEFNTPLGNLVTLLDGFSSSDDKDDYLPLIQKNIHRVISLIERLKKVADIDTNETPEEFRLREAIDDVIRGKNFELKNTQIQFVIELADDLEVKLPRVALESALIQLIENAMTHAFDETFPAPTIWVAAEKLDGRLRIMIKDNGKGLPEHVRTNLFVPFSNQSQQLSISTGVGLFSAYQLVHQVLHGRIELCRDAVQSTEFCIEIPLDS
jgi:signal transduction histidine kinase